MIQPIVVDTNVLISGYLWKGKPRDALRVIRTGRYRLLYCRQSLDELIRVLSLKFSFSAADVYRIVEDIKAIGKPIVIASCESPITEDLSDNLFVNLAIDGGAKTIISGDSHLIKLKKHMWVRVVSVSEFLDRLS